MKFERNSPNPDHVGKIADKVQTVVGKKGKKAYKLPDGAVTLSAQKTLTGRRKIDVVARETTPEISPEGIELFPYREIKIVPSIGKPATTEKTGVKARKNDGTFGDWKKGEKEPRGEREISFSLKKTKPNYEPDLKVYADLVEKIDQTTPTLDKYGRTAEEKEREEGIVEAFGTQVEKMFSKAEEEGKLTAYDTIIYPTIGRTPNPAIPLYKATYALEDGGEIVIKQERKNRIKIFADNIDYAVVLSQWNEPHKQLHFKIREGDKRLGVKEHGKKYDNPAPIDLGEKLIQILSHIESN